MSLGVVLFIFSILIVVMVHESGHFFVAKLFGFKATKFFVGFGPKLWSIKRGETEYGVGAIPAGGYVKIVGMSPYEEVAPEDVPRAYPNKPAGQRSLLLLAGSATHWVLAFFILYITAMALGFPTGRATNQVAAVETGLRVENGVIVAPDTPASEAGIRPGDVIVAINGKPTPTWAFVRNNIRFHPNEVVRFTVSRDEQEREVPIRLGSAVFNDQLQIVKYYPPGEEPKVIPGGTREVVGFLGIQPEPEYDKDGPIAALGTAGKYTAQVTWLSIRGIGEVFNMVFGGELWHALQGEGQRDVDEGPLGLVGAGRIAGETVERGRFIDFIGLIVGFTIFVGLMNLLPLPPLDGGHLAVVGYEKLTGRRVDVRKLIPVAAAVISFFVLLFVAVLYLDLARPIRNPF